MFCSEVAEFWKNGFQQACKKKLDEILEFLLDDNDPASDVEVDLGDELSSKELDSDWE